MRDEPPCADVALGSACSTSRPRLYSVPMRHEPSTVSARGAGRPGALSLTALSSRLAVLLVLAATLSCRAQRIAQAPPRPPATDFLLAAGDSTFWITSGPQGVRVRGSPLLLAHYGGRFYELYVADEDHSFYDAVFTTQRIYRRDLLTGDSDAVFRDSTVAMAAHGYGVAHPHDAPLTADEDAAEDPATSVTGEVDIVDVDGPFLSYEYHGSTSVKRPGSSTSDADGSGAMEHESVRRGVVDLRGGHRATLRGAFGLLAAESAAARGRRAFSAAVDSIRAARSAGDERAGRAAEAVGELTFDPMSFSVLDINREPAVQFFARGTGVRGGPMLALAPVRLSDGAQALWWAAEASTFPAGGADSASDVWTRPDVEVVARYDTIGDPNRGQGVVLLLRRPRTAANAGDTARREWRVGRFPAPTRRVYWLDTPPVDSATRRALVRAFDESALYGEDARSVRLVAPVARGGGRVAFAALTMPQVRGAHGGARGSETAAMVEHRQDIGARGTTRVASRRRRPSERQLF
jgi:hypothetical protein